MEEVPAAFRERFSGAASWALRCLAAADPTVPALAPSRERAWKLFFLLARMLLRPTEKARGRSQRAQLEERFQAFAELEWDGLIAKATRGSPRQSGPRARTAPGPGARRDPASDRGARARAQVQRGRWTRAREALTSSPIAPGTAATLAALRDPAKRPPVQLDAIPPELMAHPGGDVQLDRHTFEQVIRSSARGKAAGPSGWRYEHLRLLLLTDESAELLGDAGTDMARAHVPPAIIAAIAPGRMTALAPRPDKIRGITSGDVFRRAVARALAAQYAEPIRHGTDPFQFALSTRAGMDGMSHLVRTWTELHPRGVVVKLDGRGAFDNVRRAAMLRGARDVVPEVLPFVRMWYGTASTTMWTDDEGRLHLIAQGEGGEQGDPLMPALYALAQHPGLVAAQRQLDGFGAKIVAYLDDIYVLVPDPANAATSYQIVTEEVERACGVQSNASKTQAYSATLGPAPPGLDSLRALDGPEVWVSSPNTLPEARGIEVVGVPVGSDDFVSAHTAARMALEVQFLEAIPELEDPQCEWLLLRLCAEPRANHLLRTCPPSTLTGFAQARDDHLWTALSSLLHIPASCGTQNGRFLASLPGRYGGLGLRSAVRNAPAAYFGGLASALPTIAQKLPVIAASFVAELEAGGRASRSLTEAAAARDLLVAEGWDGCPEWRDLANGSVAPPSLQTRQEHADSATPEEGEFAHGWQFHAADARERSAVEAAWAAWGPTERAMLLSQIGAGAATWLTTTPSDAWTELKPSQCVSALRRRIWQPLPASGDACPGCDAALDPHGWHLSSCGAAGRLQTRGVRFEAVWRQALEDGGARVPRERRVSRLGLLGVASDDARRIDAVAHGVHGRGGLPLVMDCTLRGVLTREGQPHPRADREGGSTFARAYADKLRPAPLGYGDLASSSQCCFEVLAAELGGRFDANTRALVADLAAGRAEGARPSVRRSMLAGWRRRLWGVLSVGLQRVVAESLVPADSDEAAAEVSAFHYGRAPRVDAVHVLEVLREVPAVSGLGPLRL